MLSGKTIFFIEFKCEIVLVQQTALNQKSIYLKNGMITNHNNVMINHALIGYNSALYESADARLMALVTLVEFEK